MARFIQRLNNSDIKNSDSRNISNTTPGITLSSDGLEVFNDVSEIAHHIYSDEEIKKWRIDESISNHPFQNKPTFIRSKLAYQEIMKNVKASTRYILPGQFCLFGYKDPKLKDKLDYYDATPFGLSFGIMKTKEGNPRELLFNVHFYPPYARARVMNTVYEVYKTYYQKYFNNSPDQANTYINYKALMTMLKYQNLAFGLRMYIPVLRGKTYVLPTKLLPTAYFTEGHFNGATLAQIRKYWRRA